MPESRFNGEVIRGTPSQIEKVYEGKAYAALRAGNLDEAEAYFQQAEHWKKSNQ